MKDSKTKLKNILKYYYNVERSIKLLDSSIFINNKDSI